MWGPRDLLFGTVMSEKSLWLWLTSHSTATDLHASFWLAMLIFAIMLLLGC